jgi:hypothetical protein
MNRRPFGHPIGQDNYTIHWTINFDAVGISDVGYHASHHDAARTICFAAEEAE